MNLAPQSLGLPDLARQSRTAAAIAGPCEPAVPTPHDPSWAIVTTVTSSSSTAFTEIATDNSSAAMRIAIRPTLPTQRIGKCPYFAITK
jgi:hypothetical protein